jgi:hypothetical protein
MYFSPFVSLFLILLLSSASTAFHLSGNKLATFNPRAITMGNNAKFGIFSPAVYAAKFVLGEAKLNKVLGKVSISFFF